MHVLEIYAITVAYDIDLQIQHIQGHKNIIADALSRIHSPKGISQEMLDILNSDFVWDNVPIHYFNLDLQIKFQVRFRIPRAFLHLPGIESPQHTDQLPSKPTRLISRLSYQLLCSTTFRLRFRLITSSSSWKFLLPMDYPLRSLKITSHPFALWLHFSILTLGL